MSLLFIVSWTFSIFSFSRWRLRRSILLLLLLRGRRIYHAFHFFDISFIKSSFWQSRRNWVFLCFFLQIWVTVCFEWHNINGFFLLYDFFFIPNSGYLLIWLFFIWRIDAFFFCARFSRSLQLVTTCFSLNADCLWTN